MGDLASIKKLSLSEEMDTQQACQMAWNRRNDRDIHLACRSDDS